VDLGHGLPASFTVEVCTHRPLRALPWRLVVSPGVAH
jgi:hypothetical protein